MISETKVVGVILAGGKARRMNFVDKGLLPYRERPLVSYAINALMPVVDEVVISANRNLERYRNFGLLVVPDQSSNFDGPLSGILSVMKSIDCDFLLVVPCDSPLVTSAQLSKLLLPLFDQKVSATIAFDGKRLHPVFMAVRTSLATNLQAYLASGKHRIDEWLAQLATATVDFSDVAGMFVNINSPVDLAELEKSGSAPHGG